MCMYTSSSVTMSCTVCGMPSANCGVPLDGMPTSNRETLHWIRDKLNNLKLTEEQIKEETKNTFGEHCATINKQTIFNRLKAYLMDWKAVQSKSKRKSLQGTASNDYLLKWLEQKPDIKYITDTNKEGKKEQQQTEHDFKKNSEIRERMFNHTVDKNSEILTVKDKRSKIIDTERTIFTLQSDGSTKPQIIKETFAKVPKRKSDNKENSISNQTKRRRVKSAEEIVEHLSGGSNELKADIVSKIIDSSGIAQSVMKKSKTCKETVSMNVEETASLISGVRSSDLLWAQARRAFNRTLGFSPIASARKINQYRDEILPVKKIDWNYEEKNIYQNKQGKNKRIPRKTTVGSVKDLKSTIQKFAEFEGESLDLSKGVLPVCYDSDAGGGRVVSSFAFLNRKDEDIKLHPFIIFEGSDDRKNMEMTLGHFTEQFRRLEGAEVEVNGKQVKIMQFGLFDLCALNILIGKQNHSATFPCAWTNVHKDHLQNHAGIPHTPENCPDIDFLTNSHYEKNLAHHVVASGDKSMNKTGKEFGSIVNNNLIPFSDIFRYIAPSMHVFIGLTNDSLKELKQDVVKADLKDTNNEHVSAHHDQVQIKLLEMYEEIDEFEAQIHNVTLAQMVVLNDLKRVPLIKEGKVDEAAKVAEENYNTKKKRKSKNKPSCDAELCLIFSCDVENDWDETFSCKNMCEIHVRCEGAVLMEEGDEMPENYECHRCKNGETNQNWLEETLTKRNDELLKKFHELNVRITSVKAEIDHHENMEECFSGPRQRLLKEAMKVLGDIARYHGGDLQGKQVQKLLDDFRGEKPHMLLKCVEDDQNTHSKFVRVFSTLANASDALKLPIEEFDDEDLEEIKKVCEKWGEIWTTDFPNRNITPKGHILSFVIPKLCLERKNYYRFYKVEQKGESIHAELNDIERKVWCIRKKEDKLWKLVERYELRNVTNVDIVKPMKKTLKQPIERQHRYI